VSEPLAYSTKEAARLVGLPDATLRMLISRDEIDVRKIGGHVVIMRGELAALLERAKVTRRVNLRRSWSRQEEKNLIRMIRSGKQIHEIAPILDRSEYGIWSRVRKLRRERKIGRIYARSQGPSASTVAAE
jgi:excisionase family DNA binding protein